MCILEHYENGKFVAILNENTISRRDYNGGRISHDFATKNEAQAFLRYKGYRLFRVVLDDTV